MFVLYHNISFTEVTFELGLVDEWAGQCKMKGDMGESQAGGLAGAKVHRDSVPMSKTV